MHINQPSFQDPFRMSEAKLNVIGLKYLKERAYREIGGGQRYLHDKYTMATLLEMEWWKEAASAHGAVDAPSCVSGIVCVDVKPGELNPSTFKMVFFIKPGCEARVRVYFRVCGFTRTAAGTWVPIGLQLLEA